MLAKPECRVLNLVGLGGVGKSRLALKLAEGLRDDDGNGDEDNAAFVSLATLTSARLIPSAIGKRRFLLVLNNYEHLPAGAGIAEDPAQACPNLELLVTSRERLNIEAEWLLVLSGLNCPQVDKLSLEEVLQFDAP